MHEPLLFSGIRWSGAKVVARKQVAGISFPAFPGSSDEDGKKVLFEDTLIIETTGQGRPYSVSRAEGWWRDFAELPLNDEKRVLSFLRRRGDPFGALAPGGKQISTYDWRILKATLRYAAMAWDPEPDEAGVSHFHPVTGVLAATEAPDTAAFAGTVASAGALTATEAPDTAAFAGTAALWANELDVHFSGVSLVVSAKTLAAYLCAAAAASVRAGLPMRRCEYCRSWFTVHNATARQCSASCRAARFNKRTSPHGFISED